MRPAGATSAPRECAADCRPPATEPAGFAAAPRGALRRARAAAVAGSPGHAPPRPALARAHPVSALPGTDSPDLPGERGGRRPRRATQLHESPPGVALARRAGPARGYALYVVAAFLFALNGTVAKAVMASGVDVWRLSQLRTTGAFLVLLAFVAVSNRAALRLHRGELPLLLVYGLLGIAATQALYFFAIQRLPIGVTLLIEFTSPIVIALWFHFVLRHRARPAVWAGLVMAVAGLAVVARVWEGLTLDPLGLAGAVAAMLALVLYFLSADAQVRGPFRRDPVSLTMWGMGAAAVFWAVAQPWWSYPWGSITGVALTEGTGAVAWPIPLLVGYVVVLGTVVPFSLVVLSLQHLRASQASVVGMTEPILGIAIAWLLLGETMTPVQLIGAGVVLGGILLAESHR